MEILEKEFEKKKLKIKMTGVKTGNIEESVAKVRRMLE